ncbi:MAG: hypothetical protein ABMB14_38970, partial [Myxococcota bacterium]
AGGAAGQWLVAAQATEEPRPRQLEVAGAVFAAHWAATFLYVLSPAFGQKDDLRFSVMLTAIAAITIGTAVWSFGRTARTIPGVWRRVVQ